MATTLPIAPRKIATTATADATLVAGTHTPVNATAAARTMTLPTGAPQGATLSVEKTDSSTNTVTLSGSIRGSASTLSLSQQYQALTLIADSTGSWWPTAGHMTKNAMDALYSQTTAGRALATAADAAAQRTALSVYSKAEAVTQTVTASSATPTPTGSSLMNQLFVTALAAAATIAAPSGTAYDGNVLIIRLKDNGTARTLTFNAIYRAIGVTLPATTVLSKTLYLAAIYNAADAKWDVVDVRQEA